MTFKAREELAMVLPIPVQKAAREDAVKFISLKEYPDFFDDLHLGFPQPTLQKSFGRAVGVAPGIAPLPVVSVGSFDASFVPTVKDFARLDERFRLPAVTWEKLPQYLEFGFAIFKLKPGATTTHPMAFAFPRADVKALFFPTVHIHDGKVHAKADFDHTLYCQSDRRGQFPLRDWQESPGLARTFLKMDKTQGIIAGEEHCYMRSLRGNLANRDTILLARA